jgi:hypothetical protein
MGHLVTDKGVLPDPDKVAAIRNMPPPTDLHGVHRLCGTVNFLSDFIPSLASIMEPINMLKRKHVELIHVGRTTTKGIRQDQNYLIF